MVRVIFDSKINLQSRYPSNRQRITTIFTHRIQGCQDVLRWHIILYIVNSCPDKTHHRVQKCGCAPVTSSRTSSGVPKDRTCCVSTPPPQNVIRSPKVIFKITGIHTTSRSLHRVQNINTRPDKGFNQPRDASAAVLVCFPRCVLVNPVALHLVTWLVKLLK